MAIKVASVLVLALCLLTACSGPSNHTSATGALHGQVVAYGGPIGAQNGPLPGQTVGLVDDAGHVVASTRTDARGNYLLSVAPGLYRVLGEVCSQAVHHVTIVAGQDKRLDLVCQMR